MITTYATGVLGLLLVLALWIGVQSAWKRAFPGGEDPDALAGRQGCHGCGCTERCSRAEEES